jgi:hypothetical protein
MSLYAPTSVYAFPPAGSGMFSGMGPLRFGHTLPNGQPCNHAHHHHPLKRLHSEDSLHRRAYPAEKHGPENALQKTLAFFKAFFRNLLKPAHRHEHSAPPRSIGQRIRDGFRYLIDWFKEAFRHIAEDARSLLWTPLPAEDHHHHHHDHHTPDHDHKTHDSSHGKHDHDKPDHKTHGSNHGKHDHDKPDHKTHGSSHGKHDHDKPDHKTHDSSHGKHDHDKPDHKTHDSSHGKHDHHDFDSSDSGHHHSTDSHSGHFFDFGHFFNSDGVFDGGGISH